MRELFNNKIEDVKHAVIPNAVDTNRFIPMDKDPSLEKQLLLEDKFVIGYVGSVLEYEGLTLLLTLSKTWSIKEI